MVLRRYLRGGWAAKLSRQRYIFTGATRSRPFREYQILSALSALGLPVPKPVAAICEINGFTYAGALITATIPSVVTLADLLAQQQQGTAPGADTWQRVGKCIHRFHAAGVWHADLNARKILIDDQQRVFLIDFDRAKYSPGKPVNGQANMNRLKRSLLKLWPSSTASGMETAWEQLMEAYNAG
jgi:3-deoxy-D-manno-octulosonic acid kinase